MPKYTVQKTYETPGPGTGTPGGSAYRVLLLREDGSESFNLVAISHLKLLNSQPINNEQEADLFVRGMLASDPPKIETIGSAKSQANKALGEPQSPHPTE